MAVKGIFVEGTDALVRAADSGLRDIRSAGAKLEGTRGKTDESYDRGSVAEGSCGLPGYLSKGVYVDELQIAQGEWLGISSITKFINFETRHIPS